MASNQTKELKLDVSDLKEQSWNRVYINKWTLAIGQATFSLESGQSLRTKELADNEQPLTTCSFDGSSSVADIIKTPHGLRIETNSSMKSRRIEMLPLRMHDDVKDVIFCSDQVIAIQSSSHLLHFKTDGSLVTQSNSAVNQLCSQNPRIVSHSEMT